MPKSMTADTANLIVQALQRGLSRSEIASVVGVSRRAITRISTNLRLHGQPKAPPSGLKQGRPIKMSEAQANAMLGWMAGRDYTFYIKDLTAFLKDKHAFGGCDGTVRRALIRAGFKRKMPYHKGEITAWIPPDGPPDLSFVMHPKPPPKSKKSRAAVPVTTVAPGLAAEASTDVVMKDGPSANTNEDQMRLLQAQAQAQALARKFPASNQQSTAGHHPGIDPALEEATIITTDTSNSSPGVQHSHAASTVSPLRSSNAPASSLASPGQMPQSGQAPSIPAMPQAHADLQQPLAAQDLPAAKASTRSRKRAPAHPRTPRATAQPQQQQTQQPPAAGTSDLLTALQSEVARQQEIIAQLQRQLAQNSSGPSPVAAMPTSAAEALAAATASAEIHVTDDAQLLPTKREHTDDEADNDDNDDHDDQTDDLIQPTSEQLGRLQALIDTAGSGPTRSDKSKAVGGSAQSGLVQESGHVYDQVNEDDDDDDDDAI